MVIKHLHMLDSGETGNIVKIRGAARMHRYLLQQGLAVGRRIARDKTDIPTPGAPVWLWVNSRNVTLESEIAAGIHVEVS